MIGLDTFGRHFKDFNDRYILIGGAACDDHFKEQGLLFRATKDIDLIFVVEALDDIFIEHFWEFIIQGKYEKNEIAEEKQYYRFINPRTEGFPVQVEIFSRTPDVINLKDGMRFTPIPTAEDISSLSAILMDTDYYTFTLENSVFNGQLHRADNLTLICLKAKAFLDLSERKAKGDYIDSKQIKKHKNDVLRLAATLPGKKKITLTESLRKDLTVFIDHLIDNPPDTKNMFRQMGIIAISTDDLIEQLIQSYNLG